MSLIQFLGALELGLLYGVVALGVYLTFRAINFPDLTVDGSFPLGGVVAAALLVKGYDPLVATLTAGACGGLAGFVTGFLHVRWQILGLLAGILTMSSLYSINLRILGKPNSALLEETTLFTNFRGEEGSLYCLILVLLVVLGLLYGLLASQWGLALRAIGSNPKVSSAYGIDVGRMTIIGLAMSNALVALAGALFAQAYGFADVSMGTGTLITGLASVIVGETLLPQGRLVGALLACLVGSVIYRVVISLALNAQVGGLQASDLNLITAILVVGALSLPHLRSKLMVKVQTAR